MQNEEPRSIPRVALLSAIAGALCLGLPAGLLFWLILAGEAGYSAVVDPAIDILRENGLRSVFLVMSSSVMWSYFLGRISGYGAWWRIATATAVGILAAWFSPLANVDGILYNYRPDLPIHMNYAASMAGLVGGVTLFVGVMYGLILRNVRASLTLGLATSLASMLIMLLTIFVFDFLGIRVGTGNFAMSKVTLAGLMMSSIVGGMTLGVRFRWFVENQPSSSPRNDSTIP